MDPKLKKRMNPATVILAKMEEAHILNLGMPLTLSARHTPVGIETEFPNG